MCSYLFHRSSNIFDSHYSSLTPIIVNFFDGIRFLQGIKIFEKDYMYACI